MSTQLCYEPVCSARSGAFELEIEARERDLGGFTVRRVLPAAVRRMVGPFIFFDEMGPAVFPPGQGIDVRPHPHIGLATITYLFEGEIVHRDSLGFERRIQPGAVNLMTAGRGIVHSERTGRDREIEFRMHGIQSWMALPTASEEIEPAFAHYPADALPARSLGDVELRLIVGYAYGLSSPVAAYSPVFYVEALLPAHSELSLPDEYSERAAYIVSGAVACDDERVFSPGTLLVARPGEPARLRGLSSSRIMLIGGEPLGPRHIWWNFVSSSEERIEQAKSAWRSGGFDRIAGDDEFIPLPDD